jgi:rare lipoprotein A
LPESQARPAPVTAPSAVSAPPQVPARAEATAASGTHPESDEVELLRNYEGKRPVRVLSGKATYYANSLAGRKTASGQVYDPKRFTAAHRKLPFGTVIRVIRKDTNQYVYVRVTDRGPFAGGNRIIDLSYIAAERLGMLRMGVAPVRLEVLE